MIVRTGYLGAGARDVDRPRARVRIYDLRHSSGKTTLDVYGHMWPDKDESARAVVQKVLAARADSLRSSGDRTGSDPR